MKRVIIIHGWGGRPDQNWLPLLKGALEKSGYQVNAPNMPDTKTPKFPLWLQKLEDEIGSPDENLYLIGHSLGCITIMRYLETLPTNEEIAGAIFLAGFTDNLGIPEVKTFFEKPVNYADIKQKAKKFVALHSDNDQYVALKYADIFRENLGAEVIIKHNMEHFSDPKDDQEVAVLLENILHSM